MNDLLTVIIYISLNSLYFSLLTLFINPKSLYTLIEIKKWYKRAKKYNPQ